MNNSATTNFADASRVSTESADERRHGNGWQPIETAPRMKTILLWAATDIGEDGRIKNWKMETGFWHSGAETWMWAGSQVRKYDAQPTHWMPLPNPPTVRG